tara:strand:+ start:2425 stop:2667 length:243 start_codon:yes stop_codon:yes gene_type:complete
MKWKKELKKADWRINPPSFSNQWKPATHALPNELSHRVAYLVKTKEERDLTEEEMKILKEAIEIYDTYVNHMGPLIDELR